MRISDWSSDVCSSGLVIMDGGVQRGTHVLKFCRRQDTCPSWVMSDQSDEGEHAASHAGNASNDEEEHALPPPLPRADSRKRRRNAIRPHGREARMIEQVAWKHHARVRACKCVLGVLPCSVPKTLEQLLCFAELTIVAHEKTDIRSEEHKSELKLLMRNASAVFCLKTK